MSFEYKHDLTGTPGAAVDVLSSYSTGNNGFDGGYADGTNPLTYDDARATSSPTSMRVRVGYGASYVAWALPGVERASVSQSTDPPVEKCAEFSTDLYLPRPFYTGEGGACALLVFGVQRTSSGQLSHTGGADLAGVYFPGDLNADARGQALFQIITPVGAAIESDAYTGGQLRIPLETWVRFTLRITLPGEISWTVVNKASGAVVAQGAYSITATLVQVGRTFSDFYAVAWGGAANAYSSAQNYYYFNLDDLRAASCPAAPAAPAGEVDYDNSGVPNQDVENDQTGDGDDDAFKDFPCPPRYRVQRSASAPTRLVRLGTARAYRCAILDRGGRRLIWDVPDRAVSAVSWERRANETGVHSVTITKRPGLLKALGGIRAWAHEAIVWRVPERGQPQLCAVGPVTGRLENAGSVTLTFKDLTAWWGKRVIHHDYSFVGCTDLTTIARYLINDGMAPDDPNFLQHARWYASGVSVTRSGAAFRLMLDAEIADLTGLGLDWTMTGRRLVVSGELAALWPRVAKLNRQHFLVDVEVEETGEEALTRAFVTGSGTAIGYAGGVDERLGLLEQVVQSEAVTDGNTARVAARAALAVAYPTPVYVRVPDGAALSPEAPLTLEQLLPGVAVDVEIVGYANRVGQTQRLTRVAGQWQQGVGEQIAVALSPYAAVPPDDGSPVGPPVIVEDVETEPDETVYDQASDQVVGAASLPDDGDEAPEESGDDGLPEGAEEGDTGSDEGGQADDGPDTGAPDIGDNPDDTGP